MSSDRPSLSGLSTLTSPPPSVNPEPAYIAASAAAQIVTSKHQDHVQDWYDEVGTQPPEEMALVLPASLMLVNSFLDHLLYNFLFTAKSTSLASLRPAVSEVLRPRLATEAIAGADQELEEFLGGGDDEELSVFHNGQEPGADCDMELVWKRTRLRCMVYTRLGDMEEEEEDMWVERECLEDSSSVHRRFSRDSEVVSPAVAIFLTSILEFVGEQALMVAGEAAYARILKSAKDPAQSVHLSSAGPGRMVVEELDMEKVAFNTTLGRLWRTWRKRIRSPTFLSSRALSRESTIQRTHSGPLSNSTSRKSSVGATDNPAGHSGPSQRPSALEVAPTVDPASIPLPGTDDDMEDLQSLRDESRNDGEGEGTKVSDSPQRKRPRSMLVFPSSLLDTVTSDKTGPRSQGGSLAWHFAAATSHSRNRSNSLPDRERDSQVPSNGSRPGSSTFVSTWEPPRSGRRAAVNDTTNHGVGAVTSHQPFQDYDGEQPSKYESVTGAILGSHTAGRDTRMPAGELEGLSKPVTDMEEQEFENEEPQILRLTRVSLEGAHSPIEVVQTRSRAPSSTRSFKTPEGSQTRDRASQEYQLSHAARSPTRHQLGGIDLVQSSDDSMVSDASRPSPGVISNAEISGDDDGYFAKREIQQGGGRDQAVASRHKGLDDVEVSGSEKQHPRFVFPSSVPSPSQRTFSIMGKDLQSEGTLMASKTDSPTSSLHRGLPALATLREITEDSHEGPDEPSSSAPSLEPQRDYYASPSEQTRIGSYQRPNSSSSGQSTYAKRSSNGSMGTDMRNEQSALRAEPTIDRAAAQRGSSPKLPQEFRRSGSSGRDKQPSYASGSGSQTVNKVIGRTERPSGPTETPAAVSPRSSNGSGSIRSGKHSQTIPKPDDKQRSFEQLIRSDETLQYTLTPQNMRDMEVRPSDGPKATRSPNSVRSPDLPGRSSQGLTNPESAALTRNPTQTRTDPTGPSTARSIGSNVIPQADAHMGANQQSPAAAVSVSVKNRSVVKAPASPPQATNVRRGGNVARDARVEKESVRDLADFLRSTGPDPATNSIPRYTNSRPTTAINTEAQPNVRATDSSPKRAGKSAMTPPPVVVPQKSKSTVSPKKSGPRLQARGATVPFGDRSSDLIDFIRQGPPRERDTGTHRIPLTVAPFRSTMDSDEIDNGMARESAASARDGSMSKSLRSSANSRTGLLETTNRGNGIVSHGISSYPASSADEPHRPQRKQRRVRDPYAIDSDSDEDLDVGASSTAKRGEESLIDFLRNVPAPVSPTKLQSAFDDIDESEGFTTRRKASGPSVSTRSTQRGSMSGRSPNIRTTSAGMSVPPSRTVINPPQRATSDNPRGVNSTSTTHLDRQSTTPARATPRSTAPLQARSGRMNNERSNDLADFLKNSGPPPTTQTYAPSVAKGDDGGFTRMFSRRKKIPGLVH